jgi:hypothetical protein
MIITRTVSGCERIDFYDRMGRSCNLQQAMTSGSYLDGTSRPDPDVFWCGPSCLRMAITRRLLRELMPHFQAWLETGNFEIDKMPIKELKPEETA